MREILFRGKRIDNGEWVFGHFYESKGNGKNVHRIYNGNIFRHDTVCPETVGQYTGLTDKNGEKIFEGDIVNGLFLFERPIKAVVTFQDGAFGLRWPRGSVIEFSAFTSLCNVEYEVIGNIHDNPELLN